MKVNDSQGSAATRLRKTRRPKDAKHLPAGRPVEYDPAYCKAVIAHACTGESPEDFAAQIGVAPSILAEWSKVHPEFSEALKRARTARVAALEDRLRELLYITTAEADAEGDKILALLAALCPEDWDGNREARLVGETP